MSEAAHNPSDNASALPSAKGTSRRSRRAGETSTSIEDVPGGNASKVQLHDVTPACRDLGGDGCAHVACAIHDASSPVVATNTSDDNGRPLSAVRPSRRSRRARFVLPPQKPAPGGNSFEVRTESDTLIEPDLGGDDGLQENSVTREKCGIVVAEIIQLWRMRQRWHRAEKALILQGKGLCRAWTGGEKEEANRLFDTAQGDGAVEPHLALALMPFLSAIQDFERMRTGIEKQLRHLARSLVVWPWVASVKGFGALNLAAIVGEAGDIGAYRNPSCLWKRMGLAVIDGGRQRRVSDPDAALVHGYNPARRAVAYLLGDTLIRVGDRCPYRPVYAGRRERTAGTHPDWTKAHSHADGTRVMVKRVLRDLWRVWRDGSVAPAAEPASEDDGPLWLRSPQTTCPPSDVLRASPEDERPNTFDDAQVGDPKPSFHETESR